jgi:hypothetical protein
LPLILTTDKQRDVLRALWDEAKALKTVMRSADTE